MEFKYKIKDLIDDMVVGIENTIDSYDKDTTLEEYYIDGTVSSNGSLSCSIISNTYKAPQTSNISNMPPSNKEHNTFCINNVYLQRLPINET